VVAATPGTAALGRQATGNAVCRPARVPPLLPEPGPARAPAVAQARRRVRVGGQPLWRPRPAGRGHVPPKCDRRAQQQDTGRHHGAGTGRDASPYGGQS